MDKQTRKKISVVLPAHNEENNLSGIVKEISSLLGNTYDMEIIIVDDGSTDGTEMVINNLCTVDSRLKGIVLYRNYGHQNALIVGISKATGDVVITMDSDYQHPPSYIPKMIESWESGSDLVAGKKVSDKSSRLSAKVFRYLGYKAYSFLKDSSVSPGVSDFRLMDKSIADVVKVSGERRLILRSFVYKYAKNPTFVEYDVGERKSGKSSYSWVRLYNLSVSNVISSSLMPLRLTFVLGLFAIVLSVLMIGFVIISKFFLGNSIIQGWATTTILLSFFFGLNFLCLGILAEYVGVIVDEVKDRPRYTVKREINF